MTTENGAVRYRQARQYVEVLRTRLEFTQKVLAEDPGHPNAERYALEVEALDWAIPTLEAEAEWLRHRTIYTHDARPEDSRACPACGGTAQYQRRIPSLQGDLRQAART